MPAEQAHITHSMLDTDLYKFSMWQALYRAFPDNQAEYRFICRNHPQFPLAQLAPLVEAEIDHLCRLRFTDDEIAYLQTLPYLKADFIDFLRTFQFQRAYLHVKTLGDQLQITASGPQIHVTGFEIFVLSIVNELYFRRLHREDTLAQGEYRLATKVNQLIAHRDSQQSQARRFTHPFEFFDFGTRRRYSRRWQEQVVATFTKEVPELFKGTSNVFLAKKYGLAPKGTMGHEYLQTYQAVGIRLAEFQKAALQGWLTEYNGQLGIALTDVVGIDAFLTDFDVELARAFDGLRHDSGDPVVWGEKALNHYAKLGIDANTKRLVFSDGLDIPRALDLHHHFADRAQCGFGIGTDLTNDMGHTPLSIVMKLVSCNGKPVAKLSDSPDKLLCDDASFVMRLRQIFRQTV